MGCPDLVRAVRRMAATPAINAGQRIDAELVAVQVDAGQAGRVRVAADRVDVAPDGGVAHQEDEDGDRNEQDNHRDGDA